ncbi:MAG: hypothetical protein J6A79_05575 [Clostridia bacterium]|nr:hypothetical protein [Clostridia bacterium]
MDLPDHPDIRMLERFGTPEQQRQPVCPICTQECQTIYLDWNGDVAGCENCLTSHDAWDYEEENT